MVKRDLKTRFKKDPKYSKHVREDVPGSDVKKYGSQRRTSSKGTFFKTTDMRAAAGWPRCSLGDGCASPKIASIPWHGRISLASSGKLKTKLAASFPNHGAKRQAKYLRASPGKAGRDRRLRHSAC